MARKDVFTILSDLARGIEDLREALGPLERVFGEDRSAASGRAPRARGKRRSALGGKSRRLSGSVARLRAMQGRYMTLVRSLSAAQKKRVRKVREMEGYAAALKLARALSSRKPG
jgi:hypothetical protein